MKNRFLLITLFFLLAGCATTKQPMFTKQQEQESQALAVLDNYTGNVLAAAALPLQYYCHHQHWPESQALDTTAPLVSNLVGLYYTPLNQNFYQAHFGLLDQAEINNKTMTNWQIIIPRVDPKNTSVQKIKLEISNDDFNIHLLNVMDFQCVEPETFDVNKTKIQSNKSK